MFMDRIEVPAAVAGRSGPGWLKLLVGLLFILVSAALMLPWTVAVTLWLAVMAAGRLVRSARDILLFAGETVLGR